MAELAAEKPSAERGVVCRSDGDGQTNELTGVDGSREPAAKPHAAGAVVRDSSTMCMGPSGTAA